MRTTSSSTRRISGSARRVETVLQHSPPSRLNLPWSPHIGKGNAKTFRIPVLSAELWQALPAIKLEGNIPKGVGGMAPDMLEATTNVPKQYLPHPSKKHCHAAHAWTASPKRMPAHYVRCSYIRACTRFTDRNVTHARATQSFKSTHVDMGQSTCSVCNNNPPVNSQNLHHVPLPHPERLQQSTSHAHLDGPRPLRLLETTAQVQLPSGGVFSPNI